jgi:hypothetical protein
MLIFIVSFNPLFEEVIQEAIASICTDCVVLEPHEALIKICQSQPDVIIIDDTIDPSLCENILVEARGLSKTRTVVINPKHNDMVLINSHRKTLVKMDDLKTAIQGSISDHDMMD